MKTKEFISRLISIRSLIKDMKKYNFPKEDIKELIKEYTDKGLLPNGQMDNIIDKCYNKN